ncbi:MAG: hypothetical protein KAS21_03675, partial [Candidatus Aminicenantes bacterium]|nr:hypothetical protein [Candidatus Aminicenantes bacterium]
MKQLIKRIILFSMMILLVSSFIAAGTGDVLEGKWTALVDGDQILLKLRSDWGSGRWSTSMKVKKGELSSFQTRKNYSFELKRDAGLLKLEGKFDSNEGEGIFIFKGSKDFNDFLGRLSIGKIDHDRMIFLFACDINKKYINDLKNLGYGDITSRRLISFAIHHVSIEYINELRKVGFM